MIHCIIIIIVNYDSIIIDHPLLVYWYGTSNNIHLMLAIRNQLDWQFSHRAIQSIALLKIRAILYILVV